MTSVDRAARLVASVRTGAYANQALVAAAVLGFAATALHWVGLVAGGALVGFVSSSTPRALVNGLSFGLLVLVGFAAWLAVHGALLTWGATGQVFLLAVATGLFLPALSAVSVRGLT